MHERGCWCSKCPAICPVHRTIELLERYCYGSSPFRLLPISAVIKTLRTQLTLEPCVLACPSPHVDWGNGWHTQKPCCFCVPQSTCGLGHRVTHAKTLSFSMPQSTCGLGHRVTHAKTMCFSMPHSTCGLGHRVTHAKNLCLSMPQSTCGLGHRVTHAGPCVQACPSPHVDWGIGSHPKEEITD